MSEEQRDDEAYRIKNWTPPWVDNGERLKELVDFCVENKEEDAWKVMCVLLHNQLQEDILRLKYLHDQLTEIEKSFNNDDA